MAFRLGLEVVIRVFVDFMGPDPRSSNEVGGHSAAFQVVFLIQLCPY